MPDMTPRERQLFDMLLGHADRVANSPPMSEPQIQALLVQMQKDVGDMQLRRSQTASPPTASAPETPWKPGDKPRPDAARRAARSISEYIKS